MGKEKYLTTKELSDMLDIKVRTLEQQRYRGIGIPFVKIGGVVKYRMSDINEHLGREVTQ